MVPPAVTPALTVTPTPTITLTVTPTPSITPTVTPALTTTPTPTPTVTPSITPSITPTTSPAVASPLPDALQQIPSSKRDGTVYWSKMTWPLPALTPTPCAQESEKIEPKEINNANFIRIIDNTPSVCDNKNKLSYFKEID